MKKTAKSTTPVKPNPSQTKSKSKSAKPTPAKRGPSGLDAAAQVLAKSKEPLTCGELTKRILDQDLWKTDGKTPAATIHSAIVREIKAKGSASRFRKVGRGLFAAGKPAR